MLISYNWLKEYLKKVPKVEKLSEILGLNAFEVEGVEKKILFSGKEDWVLDLDITPNRAHDALCHRGVAREIATITGGKMLEVQKTKVGVENPATIKVVIEDGACRRYIAKEIRGIKVQKSNIEIQEKMEAMGQKSISNIVDATNIVMFGLGQPMHAFDADKLDGDTIYIRLAKKGETMTTLDNSDVTLTPEDLVIADSKSVLAIAGVKGGKKAEVDEDTTNIILESANFHPTNIRKTSKRVGIFTDASKRYENEITPELADMGIDMAVELIGHGELGKNVDSYPRKYHSYRTGVSGEEVNNLLGLNMSEKDIRKILDAMGFENEIVHVRERIIDEARNHIGKPHKKGSSVFFDAPNIFDCSSFTSYVYAQAGMSIPRVSIDQFIWGEEIQESELEPGDLVFSNTGKDHIWFETQEFLPGTKFEKGIDHVGIFIGGGEVIHSSQYNRNGLEISRLDGHSAFKNIVSYARLIKDDKRFVVTVPVERLDVKTPVELIEEIGRIYGYNKIKEQGIDLEGFSPKINKEYALNSKIRYALAENGFSEIFTYSFVESGEIQPEKPMAEDKGFLRSSLISGMEKVLEKNIREADFLGVNRLKVFEIGKVFKKDGEILMLSLGALNKSGVKKPKESDILRGALDVVFKTLGYEEGVDIEDDTQVVEIDLDSIYKKVGNEEEYIDIPSIPETTYREISSYPFMLRDISVWLPSNISKEELINVIQKEAGDLLVRITLFDVYEKDNRISYANRLVFQSNEKTLNDVEVNEIMERINEKIKGKGWEIR